MCDLPDKGSTVVVGMSGGVDSTLVALLLKEHGCQVIGVTMSSWNNDLHITGNLQGVRNSCYGPDEKIDIDTCRQFCAEQGIEYHVIDVREAYHAMVLEYFKDEYRCGRTPNPCIRCNPTVKFGALLDGVRKEGIDFDYFCTGHYARLVRPEKNFIEGWNISKTAPDGLQQFPLCITKASDTGKDQTYFLYRIPSSVLEKVKFPLGMLTKNEVFAMARERNLSAAERSESQDFIPPEYIDSVFADRPPVAGNIVNLNGKVLGSHRGIEYYTVGQRRGLGVSSPVPLYVHSIDSTRNEVVLAENDDLLADGLFADDWVWPNGCAPSIPFSAKVKIRLATPPVDALIEPCESESAGTYKVTFVAPVRAVAPGQSVVVYIEGMIAGGGIIIRGIQHE